jgi:DNA-binding GntR family transcriptional regulator
MSHIRDGIRDGRFHSGGRIVEAELRRNLGVSRSSIREAFSRLAAEGLLEVNLYRGASVKALTPADIKDLLEIREVVEGLVARGAATHIHLEGNAEKIRLAQEKLDAAENDIDNIDTYFQANTDYHNALLEISGNARLPAMMDHLYTTFFREQTGVLLDREAVHRSNDDHRRITDAILRSDTGSAEALMRCHVQRTAFNLAQALK